MKLVTFLKRHPSGIAEGKTLTLNDDHAERLAAEEYVSIDGDVVLDGVQPNPLAQDKDKIPAMIPYKITAKDLKERPDLFDVSAKVGDTVQIPNPDYKPA